MATDIDDDSMLWKVIERWIPFGLDYLADESLWFLGGHVDTTEWGLLIDDVFASLKHAPKVEKHLVWLLDFREGCEVAD